LLYFSHVDRSYINGVERPDGVFRVVCMGDSLMVGLGCLVTEALPYQLEKALNAAVWDHQFEVVNGAVGRYSVYSAWHRYKNKFSRYAADLVILSLSKNDAELYEQYETLDASEQQMTGQEYHAHCYREDGPHFPYVKAMLQDVASMSERGGPQVVITFYDIGAEPRSYGIGPLQRACAEVGLPFVDLSEDFSSPVPSMNMMVSEADSHPSPLAHSMAAQRLVRNLIELKQLPEKCVTPVGESEIVERCLDTALTSLLAGADIGNTVHYATRVLEAKRNSRARSRLAPELQMDDSAYNTAVSTLIQVWQRWVRATRFEAYVKALRSQVQQFDTEVQYSQWITTRLSLSLDVAEARCNNQSLPIVAPFTKVAEFPYNRRELAPDEITEIFSAHLASHRLFHNRLHDIVEPRYESNSRFRPVLDRIDGNILCLNRLIAPHLYEADSLLSESVDQIQRWTALNDLNEARPNLALTDSTPKRWITRFTGILKRDEQNTPVVLGENVKPADLSLLLQRSVSLMSDLNCIIARFVEQLQCAKISPVAVHEDGVVVERYLVFMQVEIVCALVNLDHSIPFQASSLPFVLLRVVPQSSLVRVTHEFQHIVPDGRPRLYSFELLHFVEADIRIGIRGDNVEINSVAFSNRPDRKSILTISPGDFSVDLEDDIRWYSKSIFLPPSNCLATM